ncbi:pentapeptide repeat-containing protein, partial [Pseudoalteromonas sp.]|uniref:pentapeptide repeat-containing protein n=1 Tax=Pseudoalteromonas sp. TaxID=53249 RepID=UPI003D0B5B34
LANFTLANFTLANFTLANFTLANFTLANFPLANFPLANFPLANLKTKKPLQRAARALLSLFKSLIYVYGDGRLALVVQVVVLRNQSYHC